MNSAGYWDTVELGAADACWRWRGFLTLRGYGRLTFERRKHYAHRVAFRLHHGRWPEPCCCHRCDNPACCNPAHLFEGSLADNNADKCAKGRQLNLTGEAHGRAVLSESDVRTILSLEGKVSQGELARRYRVAAATIRAILLGVNWRHVTGLHGSWRRQA